LSQCLELSLASLSYVSSYASSHLESASGGASGSAGGSASASAVGAAGGGGAGAGGGKATAQTVRGRMTRIASEVTSLSLLRSIQALLRLCSILRRY
jgi:hypothetical protein